MAREWMTTARLKMRALLMRRRLDRDLEEELRFHLAMREEKIRAQRAAAGDDAGSAHEERGEGRTRRAEETGERGEEREATLRGFGNVTLLKERCREMWMLVSIESLCRDLRYSARTFARTPGFTAVVVLVMALGIGANTALFSVLRAVLLRPLPFTDADRLVSLYERDVVSHSRYNVVSGGDFEDWQKQAKSFEVMSVIGEDGANLSGNGQQLPEYVGTQLCMYKFFPMLGIKPVLGRLFSADDDRPQAQATAVLTYGLWKRRFGGDPGVIGQTIRLDSKPYTVIGVLPPVFISETRTQLWLAVYNEISPENMRFRANHRFYVWGRLRPGVTQSQAYAELDGIQQRIHREFPNELTGAGANVVPLQEDQVREVKTSLYVLMGAVGCVLLIACLNVANLFVARTASRRKEIAIRASLGAGRSRLLREQIVGSLALTGAGGALGVLLAMAALRWIIEARKDLPRAEVIHIDGAVLLFAVALTIVSGVFAGLLPAIASIRGVMESLQESSRTVGGGQSRARMRKVLLAGEVVLTVVLLIGAGLLLKSFAALRAVDMGCATDNVLTMSVSLPYARYSKPEQVAEFFSELLERVRATPGVSAAGIVNVLPGQGHFIDSTFTIEGRRPLPPGQSQDAVFRAADPGYFRAMNIRLLRGRYFTEAERLEHGKVIILSESMAREYFPNEDPIGKHIILHAPLEIVGVVGDVRSWVAKPPEDTFYIPLYRGFQPYGSLAVRSTKDVTALALPIQREIARLDPDLAVSDVMTMEQMIGESTADAKFNAAFVLFFAAVALALSAIGLYGVLSYLVAQRTNEIGVRIALGAQRPAVMQLMLADGMRPAAVGLVLGVLGGTASTRMMQSELFGVQPLDATVFAGVVALVLVVTAAACIFPAWRAARLDPMVALRCD